eukprot:6267354-Pyramimonas_sp.AAC.1
METLPNPRNWPTVVQEVIKDADHRATIPRKKNGRVQCRSTPNDLSGDGGVFGCTQHGGLS